MDCGVPLCLWGTHSAARPQVGQSATVPASSGRQVLAGRYQPPSQVKGPLSDLMGSSPLMLVLCPVTTKRQGTCALLCFQAAVTKAWGCPNAVSWECCSSVQFLPPISPRTALPTGMAVARGLWAAEQHENQPCLVGHGSGSWGLVPRGRTGSNVGGAAVPVSAPVLVFSSVS